jgi:acetylornithine deacetylase/succinyl-diaminopimelate desuccinylase-like protein
LCSERGSEPALSLRDEAIALLQALIRLDTVNPPGNETQAAELLRGYLEPHGVECRLHARAAERANLIARIPGRGDGPRLLLLSHTDTVLADPSEWQVDPWCGDVRDGYIWGRGALDMKGHVAAAAVAMASLAREGFAPRGDLVFAACADEEVGEGEQFGLAWLCEEHPEAVEAEYAINEGAGDRVSLDGRAVYLCSTAEKRSSPLTLVVHGRSGHASMPGIADNALVKAAPYLERLGAYRPRLVLSPETEGLLHALLGEVPPPEQAVERVRAASEFAAETLEPLLSLTLSPTMVEASKKRNVVPGRCEITIDCRLLPGQTEAEAEAEVRALLGPGDYELQWGAGYGGTRSPLDPVLWEAVASFVRGIEPGAELAPVCVAGFTDSHYVRERFGTVAYGFLPLRSMEPELATRLIHSADERIATDDLELGVHFLRHAAKTVGETTAGETGF